MMKKIKISLGILLATLTLLVTSGVAYAYTVATINTKVSKTCELGERVVTFSGKYNNVDDGYAGTVYANGYFVMPSEYFTGTKIHDVPFTMSKNFARGGYSGFVVVVKWNAEGGNWEYVGFRNYTFNVNGCN